MTRFAREWNGELGAFWQKNAHEEAARLLLKTDKKIINISEEVGYKDSDYFLQKFIERKGCTPSKYRRTYS